MTAAEFATLIKDAKCTQGVAWTGHCPAHGDAQSSLSWRDKGEKVLVRCHAGCNTEAVVAALELKMSDLFHHPKKQKPAAPAGPLTIEALGQAKGFEPVFLNSLGVEQHGDSVMITHRLMDGIPAARHQLRHAGSPKFTWSKGPGEIVPYGLDRLADAKAQGYLLLVEGASDCWSAWFHHVPCLGIPGADMTKKLMPEHLDGIGNIYVVKEPGNGGLTFTAGAEVRLAEFGYTGSAAIIEMPFGLKDLNELHQKYLGGAAGFHEALQSAIHTAAPMEKPAPEGPTPAAPAGKTYVLAPFGNSERLVDAYGDVMAYVPELGWLSWTGQRWRLDSGTHLVQRRAKAIVNGMAAEAEGKIATGADGKALKGWAVRCMNRAAVVEMLFLSEERVLRDHSAFDSHPMLFNVANGTVDLTTGTLQPHAREDLITQLSPATFNPAATAPTWERFLRDIMCDREELVRYLQRLVGYVLTGSTKEQSFEILHGQGENGKSTLIEVVRALMGQEYARQAPAHALMQKKHDAGPSPDIARLRGSRLVTAVEPEKGRRLAEGIIKGMTGGDMQAARHLYKETIEFATTHKLFIACNHKPRIPSSGHAMWRRIHLLPFDARFDGQKADKEMPAKLRAELSGILNWAIQGCLAWQEQGLNPPAEVLAATKEYEREEDELGEFWTDCCELDPKAKLPRADVRRAYLTWCEENGMEPMSVTAFGLAVKEKGVQAPTRAERFRGKPTKLYHGVRLVTGVTTVTGEAGVENFMGDGEAEPDVKISTSAKAVTVVTPVTRLELCPHGNPRLRCDLCCKHGKLPHRCISCSGHGNMAGSGNAVAQRRIREEAPKMDLGSYYFSREDMLAAIDRLPPHVEPPHNRGECEWRECPEHPLDPEDRFDPRNDVDLPEEEAPR